MESPRTARYPSLAGRTVIVTGGATGIGSALVEQFFLQGSRVAFIDIDDSAARDLVEGLASRAPKSGDPPTMRPLFVRADLRDIDALRNAIAHIRAGIGPIRVLLNNAADDRRHGIEETSPESWDAGVAVNLRHQFFCAQAVAEDMRLAGGGSIVNFGSISWMLKQGGMPVYTTCKAAVHGLTRSLARDLGAHRIRVNTLVPGWVMTEKQVRHRIDEQARIDIARGQCIADPLMPLHVASMALFLAADDSCMCTGQDFVVDGGWA
jgi:D-xylose 1-dehydrogenase